MGRSTVLVFPSLCFGNEAGLGRAPPRVHKELLVSVLMVSCPPACGKCGSESTVYEQYSAALSSQALRGISTQRPRTSAAASTPEACIGPVPCTSQHQIVALALPLACGTRILNLTTILPIPPPSGEAALRSTMERDQQPSLSNSPPQESRSSWCKHTSHSQPDAQAFQTKPRRCSDYTPQCSFPVLCNRLILSIQLLIIY